MAYLCVYVVLKTIVVDLFEIKQKIIFICIEETPRELVVVLKQVDRIELKTSFFFCFCRLKRLNIFG